jgi:hypothetical protein
VSSAAADLFILGLQLHLLSLSRILARRTSRVSASGALLPPKSRRLASAA